MSSPQNTFFNELYGKYYFDLFCYAKTIVKSDALAEEIVHEAFIILLTEQEKLQRHTNIFAWLVTVVRNQAYNELRSRRKHAVVSLEEIPQIAAEPQDMISFQDTLPKDLNSEDRQLLIWRYEDRMEYDEIAKRLDRSYAACRAQLHRAKKRCAKLMEKEQKKTRS